MNTTSLTGGSINIPKLPIQMVVCDDPKTGGIAGTPKKLPSVVLEERPKVYDWKAGEWKYADEFQKNNPGVCYLA